MSRAWPNNFPCKRLLSKEGVIKKLKNMNNSAIVNNVLTLNCFDNDNFAPNKMEFLS